MQEYIGTKRIKAQPMNRAAYNQYRGWDLPADEDGNDEGMLVEYIDGGKANHPDHEGYISWSPKDVFDRHYHEVKSGMISYSGVMQADVPDHIQRMQVEALELEEKCKKLLEFIHNNPKFGELPDRQQRLMVEQYKAMEEYFKILQLRMEEV